VYESLRTAILTCEIPSGAEVSEQHLAEQFEVSKTPVREALGRLATEGLVRAYPRRGYQVVPLMISDMNEIFDVRIVVESGAAEMACSRISEQELDALEELARRSAGDGGRAAVVALNREFHGAIAKATRNARMYQLVLRYVDELERFFHLGARLRNISEETIADHLEIVRLLRERNGPGVRAAIARHTEKTRSGLLLGLTSNRDGQAIIV
jgi:DNA-binding GntR family transcriptional regulator